MRNLVLPFALAAGLAANAAIAQTTPETSAQAPAQEQTYNWMDPSTWMQMGAMPGMSAPGITMPFNPANPADLAKWFDPSTHAAMHMAFTNPAQYAQFMQPQFYMQFANPNTWAAWMNPASYQAFMNPANYMYWMQPGAYTHAMNPATYMQMMNPAAYAPFMNPATYMQWMNPGAYAIPATTAGGGAYFNWFDPNAWTKMFEQGAQAPATTQ